MNSAELANRFKYHPPQTDQKVMAHEGVRAHCAQLAGFMDSTLPEGREKAVVMTKIEEAMFWANAAIARNEG